MLSIWQNRVKSRFWMRRGADWVDGRKKIIKNLCREEPEGGKEILILGGGVAGWIARENGLPGGLGGRSEF